MEKNFPRCEWIPSNCLGIQTEQKGKRKLESLHRPELGHPASLALGHLNSRICKSFRLQGSPACLSSHAYHILRFMLYVFCFWVRLALDQFSVSLGNKLPIMGLITPKLYEPITFKKKTNLVYHIPTYLSPIHIFMYLFI